MIDEAETEEKSWIVRFREADTVAESTANAIELVRATVHQHRSGRIEVWENAGPTSRWERLLMRTEPRKLLLRIALEWHGDFASLIFFDDAVSEHRALAGVQLVEADGETRLKIAHGETAPHPLDECLAVAQALAAIRDFLTFRTRPKWMKYRYVP